MAARIPAVSATPKDEAMFRNMGFFDWVRKRLGFELPPTYVGTLKNWNPPNIPSSGGTTSTTIRVPGAVFDIVTAQPVVVGCSQTLPAGSFLVAHVSAKDTVTVTLVNLTGGALNVAGIAFLRVVVWGYP